MPLKIYLAESPCSIEQLADEVNDQLRATRRCLVVISEGFDVGDLGEVSDSFGHTSFGSTKLTVSQTVVNYLNSVGLATKGAARGNVPGTDQRHSMAYVSSVDLDEAYRVGEKAVQLAVAGESGYMATILRRPGLRRPGLRRPEPVYRVDYDQVPLQDVANSERTFPPDWIAPGGSDVTDEFVDYARPLVGEDMVRLPMVDGRQRLTQFEPIFAQQKLPSYVPQADRD